MSKQGLLMITALVVALSACSSVPYAERQQQRQQAYAAAAGAPVKSFHFFTLWSWEPLSDSELAVYTRPDRAWLLDVDGTCQNLQYTPTIGLTSSVNQVWVRFDKVLAGRIPCTISQIRPVDVKLLRIKQEAQRKINAQPRESVAPASGS